MQIYPKGIDNMRLLMQIVVATVETDVLGEQFGDGDSQELNKVPKDID